MADVNEFVKDLRALAARWEERADRVYKDFGGDCERMALRSAAGGLELLIEDYGFIDPEAEDEDATCPQCGRTRRVRFALSVVVRLKQSRTI